MTNWKIETNFISDLYLILISKWPFCKLKQNKNILDTLNYENTHHRDIKIPVEDYLIHKMTSISQIVPIEKLADFAKAYDLFVRKNCKKQHYFEKRDPIEHFNNISLWGGGWFHLGFAVANKDNLFTTYSAYAYRVSDSFVQITFNFVISDNRRYLFYNILRTEYFSRIFLMTVKHPVLLRGQSMKIYSPLHIQDSTIYSYFSHLRNDFLSMLKMNNLIFHISNMRSIEVTNILSFKKVHNYKKNEWETFWQAFELEKEICFIDGKNTIYFPETLNLQSDLGEIGHFIFLCDETLTVSKGYENIEHEMHSVLRDWGMGLIRSLAINGILNDYYHRISLFRMNYFDNQNNKQIIKKYEVFQGTNYWINLLSNEYYTTKMRPSFLNNPVLMQKVFMRDKNLVELIESNNRLKIKSLNKLSSFIEKIIKEFDNYRLLKTNEKTQMFILLLTIITVFIGVLQIIGIDNIQVFLNSLLLYFDKHNTSGKMIVC